MIYSYSCSEREGVREDNSRNAKLHYACCCLCFATRAILIAFSPRCLHSLIIIRCSAAVVVSASLVPSVVRQSVIGAFIIRLVVPCTFDI